MSDSEITRLSRLVALLTLLQTKRTVTASELASRLTDAATAQLSGAAMDKLRAALRYSDRDHLEKVAPHIHVMEPVSAAGA